MGNKNKNKALILDRDGTICKDIDGYLTSIEEFELCEGILELISAAKNNGYIVVVATNQPQVAKGLLSEENLSDIHKHMNNLLENNLDYIYYCPHIDEDNCNYRKPKPGMLFKASEDFDLDLSESIMVGDTYRDMGAGEASGCKTILIDADYNKDVGADIRVSSISDIIEHL